MTTWNKKKKRQKLLPILRIELLMVAVVLAGCKSTQPPALSTSTNQSVKIIERETLVPVVNPSDSVTLTALLECDSMSNILIRELSEAKSGKMLSDFKLIGNAMRYKVKTISDTIYIPFRERVEEKTLDSSRIENHTIEVSKRDFFWFSGLVLWVGLAVIISYKIIRFYR